jgi:hypothetical protein
MMAEFLEDCPRCGAQKMTFDVHGANLISRLHGWLGTFEVFTVCRKCGRGTVFIIRHNTIGHEVSKESPQSLKGVINRCFDVHGFVALRDLATTAPPSDVPPEIENIFREGATCVQTECWNAAGAMLRLVVDLATRPLLPPVGTLGPNKFQREKLGPRISWLKENAGLPEEIFRLSENIHLDGNDAAHEGSLTKADAEDLIEFTVILLQRLYTEPARIKAAEERRLARRAPQSG